VPQVDGFLQGKQVYHNVAMASIDIAHGEGQREYTFNCDVSPDLG